MPMLIPTQTNQLLVSLYSMDQIFIALVNPQNQNGLVGFYNNAYNTIFNNPLGDAATCLAAIGTNSVALLQNLAAIATCINVLDPTMQRNGNVTH